MRINEWVKKRKRKKEKEKKIEAVTLELLRLQFKATQQEFKTSLNREKSNEQILHRKHDDYAR